MEQRAKLAAKASPAPHVMYMTATPIPRTLALVEHGDLALYAVDELPPGRSPVATRALKDTPANRALVRAISLGLSELCGGKVEHVGTLRALPSEELSPTQSRLACVAHSLLLVGLMSTAPGKECLHVIIDEGMQVYDAIKEELADGGRAYIICPLVGESSSKAMADTKVRYHSLFQQ